MLAGRGARATRLPATQAIKQLSDHFRGQKNGRVDRLIGQESTVIKPLGGYLHGSAQLAGATISGDGRVRLVLDPGDLGAASAWAQAAAE